MTDDPAKPPMLPLRAEFRIVLILSGGVVVTHVHDTLAEAEAAARRLDKLKKAKWILEMRLVSEWTEWKVKTSDGARARHRR